MNIERFQHLAEAYGAEIDRWPETERAAARGLLARSDEARHALAQARILDAFLSLGEPKVGDAQLDRVMASLSDRLDRRTGAPPPIRLPGGAPAAVRPAARAGAWWQAAAFLAAMGVLGVAAGDLGLIGGATGGGASRADTAQSDGIAALVDHTSYLQTWIR
ncbi:hypothetical protein [Azospirillum thermophilum]|uniref:hypothetical protein n=1 Tax=Azospirillum thermophilum TaxID=2202148 RepID=UPI00143DA23B|nr:hypothetical protein [Azospirillum thermophilum]